MAVKATSSVTLMMVSDGAKGSDGKGISSITHHYLVTNVTNGVTTSTSGWKTSPTSVTATNKYLWYYQTINYTTGSPTNTTPAIIGVYGDTGGKGETGRGIKSVTPEYYLSTSNKTQTGGSWKTTQDTWSSGKYYWTRDSINWNDGTTTTTTPVLATGLNNANSTANNAQTIANQTASKFEWIVKSGTSASNFTLTDRTAQLVADSINLKGLVKFTGLDSETQNTINLKTDKAQVTKYVSSRGENLITNGTGLMGDNTNFSRFRFDARDGYYSGGSFTDSMTGKSWIEKTNDELIPVDVMSQYELSYYVKTDNANVTWYDYIYPIDVDGKFISSNHVKWVEGTTTTLAKELKDGDTVVHLTNTKNFLTEVGDKYWNKGLIFWNYKNSKGHSYGIETYSRYVYFRLWDDGNAINKTNNTITLKSPWTNGTFPAGSPVSQSNSGGTYVYLNSNYKISSANTWENKRGVIQGVGKNNESGKFREGTAYVRIGWIYAIESGSANCQFSTISFTQNGNVKANQSIIDNWAKDDIVDGETVINGGYIKTNTIRTNQLAVGDIFSTGNAVMNIINSQEINANRITSGTIVANRLSLYGMEVRQKETNLITLNIRDSGDITMRGSVESFNYTSGKTGWSIRSNGDAEFNDVVVRGSLITNDGGVVSSTVTSEDATKQVRFWAGTSYKERENAPWIVYNDGSMLAQKGSFSGVFTGDIKIGNISISDPSSTSGGDALLTIQNGQNGVKVVQLKDADHSDFAQEIHITDNFYNEKISLQQDGVGLFTSGIAVGTNTSLNSSRLILNDNELSGDEDGYIFKSPQVSVGTSIQNSSFKVYGDTLFNGAVQVSRVINFNNVVECTVNANGIDFNFKG